MSSVRNRLDILQRLALRQVQMRYKDSALGLAWAVIFPLVLLVVYSFIYSRVFSARWPTPTGEQGNFALFMFSGLVLYLLIVEMLNTATNVIQGQGVLIKRTTMDVRLIPLAGALSALVTFSLTLIPFGLFYGLKVGLPPVTALLYPLVVAILWLVALGMVLMIAALSPYFRDLQQVVPLITTSLLFLSPIFYQVSQLPEDIAPYVLLLNPLATLIPASQELLFYGTIPDWQPLAAWTMVGVVLLGVSLQVFRKAAKGFADVI